MFRFDFPYMLRIHVSDADALKKVTDDRIDNLHKIVFENLLLGVNIINPEVINTIAVYLSKLSDNELKVLTLKDVEKNIGIYTDYSGYLV